MPENKEIIDRLYKFLAKEGSSFECYKWIGACDPNGFPRISINNKSVGARRAMWICKFGEIPDHMYVLNKCGDKKCINPNHLYLSSDKKNKFIVCKTDRNFRRRLNVDIPTVFMDELRKNAEIRNITITKYIIRILAKALDEERSFD
jgi:hypothetical protein